jgi:hypothetical protein
MVYKIGSVMICGALESNAVVLTVWEIFRANSSANARLVFSNWDDTCNVSRSELEIVDQTYQGHYYIATVGAVTY